VIRVARADEIDALMTLYDRVVEAMNARGLTHWDAFYPARSHVLADLRAGSVRVMCDGAERIAAATFDRLAPAEYAAVRWEVPLDRSLFVHRLAVDPARLRTGVARAMMAAAADEARERGLSAVKLDAYRDNPGASGLYPALGYTLTGQVTYPPHPAPFLTFELTLR
jgi:ribosomal protein S18 acetylase RimI-like enzyme